MDPSTTAAIVYQSTTAAIMHILYGMLVVAAVTLIGALVVIINLRIRLHVQGDKLSAAEGVIASIELDRDGQRLRRRKSDKDLAAYHARVAPLVEQVEAMKAASTELERASAFREVGRLVKLVPRERRAA